MKKGNTIVLLLYLILLCLKIIYASSNDISTITLLYTSDLHGYIEGTFSDRESEIGGGILRCSTVIKEIRNKEPNAILIDLGDLFYGSIESFPSRGMIVVEAAKYIKYDFFITGNHEFDLGGNRLIELYTNLDKPIIACNIRGKTFDMPPPIPNWKPFVIITNDNLKIAIVGLTTPLIPCWFRPKYINGFSFQKSIDALKNTMLYVRKASPDLLILAAHQGLREWQDDEANELNSVLKNFPEFNLVLGAHTHQAIKEKIVNSTQYSQPGYYGLWLGKSTIVFDRKMKKIISISPDLIEINSNIKPDPELSEKIATYISAVKRYGSEVIGELAGNLSATSSIPGQSELQTLISQAIAEATGADIVLHTSLSKSFIKDGTVTRWKLWKIVPYENTIGKGIISLNELREILEENAKFFGKDQFRGVFGCQYEIIISPAGEVKIGKIILPDKIKNKTKIALAVNSYDLASAGGRLPKLREVMEKKGNALIEYDLNTRDAVESFLKKNNPYQPFVAPGAVVKKNITPKLDNQNKK